MATFKQARSAAWLIAPALVVLAVVIGYPIVRAIWLSFQADKGLDPTTGLFTDGGFAGLDNYLYWLTQRCMGSDGTIRTCPPGTLATDFWPALRITLFFTVVTVGLETILGTAMALIMNKEFRGRAPCSRSDSYPLGNPHRRHRKTVAVHLRTTRHHQLHVWT